MSQSQRNLAVGATLEQAAETFGGLFTDVELTTYDEVGGHVDLGLLGSLSLVRGTSSDALLPGIVAQHGALGPAAPPVYVGREGSIVEVLPGAAPSSRLGAATVPSPQSVTVPDEASARRGSVTRQLLVGGLAAGILAVVLVVVAGGLGGMSWALLVLGLEILAAQALLLVGVGYAVLLLRRAAAREEEERAFRHQVTHRSGRLLEHARENVARQRRRFDAVDRALADLRGTRDRVDALSRLVSREQARQGASPAEPHDVSGDREHP